MVMFGLIICNLAVTTRLPPKKVTGPFIDFGMFRYKPYAVYCSATFIAFLGLYTVRLQTLVLCSQPSYRNSQVLTYIDISAAFVGVDENFSFYLVSIANAGSALGRVSAGFLSDRFGA